MLSKVKLLSDDIFDILQPEFLETDAAGSSSDDLFAEESSDEVSDEDSSDDDLDLINEDEVGEDISMSEDTSSDDDGGTLADDELNTTDSFDNDTTNDPPPSASLHTQVINELKQMYSHRYEVPHIRMPKPHEPFLKHLLKTLKAMRPDHFRIKLRVSPLTFDRLIKAIENDPVFVHHSRLSPKAPIEEQLGVALYRFGHNGNAASLQSIANWAGIGKGTVELYTRRVMVALLRPEFMRSSVHWPDEAEKEAAKEWVQNHSCKAWRDGWCFVDGTLVPLASRPYWYGESYFDRKCRYSLNVQVCFPFLYRDATACF
jgi:hypothetical protein